MAQAFEEVSKFKIFPVASLGATGLRAIWRVCWSLDTHSDPLVVVSCRQWLAGYLSEGGSSFGL